MKAIHNRLHIIAFDLVVVSDYKDTNFLKAIHNGRQALNVVAEVVSDYKDTNF